MTLFRNTLVFLVILLTCSASAAQAQQVEVTCMLRPMYLGANGGVFANQMVAPCFVSISSGELSGSVWGSTGFDREPGFDKEVDLTLAYSRLVSKTRYSADLSYFAIQGIDVLNGNLEMAIEGPVTMFVRAEFYAPRTTGGPRKGMMAVVGARTGFPVLPKMAISLSAWGKKDHHGAFGFNEAMILQGKVGVAIAATPKFSLLAGVMLSRPLTPVTDGRKPEAVWEVGFSRRF